MDSIGFRNSVSSLQGSESRSSIEGSGNPRGVKQEGGTASRLSGLVSALAQKPGMHQGVRSLADTITGLREEVGSHKSWGRFKNAMAEKLPFIGKTTYGRILQQADGYAANAKSANLCRKVEMLEGLKRDIDAWRQSHGTDGAKGKAIAGLDARLTQELSALRAERDQKADTRMRAALPVIVQPSANPGDPIDLQGDLTGKPLQRFQHILGNDAFTRARDGGPKNIDNGNGLPVSEVFHKDFIGRHAALNLYSGDTHVYDREAPKAGNAGEALRKLTGDPATATALSHYLGQHMMAGLEGAKLDLLKGPNDRLNLALDGGQQFSYEVRRNPPDRPGGDASYTIDYRITDPIRHLGNAPDDHLAFKPGSEFRLTARITVSESDLRAGNGAFTVTGAPGFELHLEPDLAGIVHPRELA